MELEATLKNSLEELETKNKEISLLQKQVIDLEQKLQHAGDKISVKVILLPKVPKHVLFVRSSAHHVKVAPCPSSMFLVILRPGKPRLASISISQT